MPLHQRIVELIEQARATGKPLLLDAYCCEHGAGEGYRRAGWAVIGVDIRPQPRAPGPMVVGDAIEVVREFGYLFDAGHASPPCQLDSGTHRINKGDHPDLIGPTREALLEAGLPYVIENVEGALPKLREPIVMLCGTMFGRQLYRHRYFETNWYLPQPAEGWHKWPQVKMGRMAGPDEVMQIVGNFPDPDRGRRVMEMPWASRRGMAEAIPPYYTEYIGRLLLEHIGAQLQEAA